MEIAHGYGKNTSNALENLPAGYRFKPTNGELVENYLINKVLNYTLPPNNIKVVDLYKFHPRVLSEMYKQPHRETEYYFFTSRDKKYPNGSRPNRVVGNDFDPCGFWKASGADINIYSQGKLVGYKKVLVFYERKCMTQTPVHDQGDSRKRTRQNIVRKTDWIMYEFRVAEEYLANAPPRAPNDKKLDDCVLCMIYENIKREKETNNQKSDLTPQLKLAGHSQNDQDTAMVNTVPVPILPSNNDMLIHVLSPFMTSPPYLDSSSYINLPQGYQMIGHENIHYQQQQFGHIANITVQLPDHQQPEFGHVQLPDLLPNPQREYIDPFEAALHRYHAYSNPRQEEEAKPKIQDEEAKPGVHDPISRQQ